MDTEIISTSELAKRLDCSKNQIHDLRNAGDISSILIGKAIKYNWHQVIKELGLNNYGKPEAKPWQFDASNNDVLTVPSNTMVAFPDTNLPEMTIKEYSKIANRLTIAEMKKEKLRRFFSKTQSPTNPTNEK